MNFPDFGSIAALAAVPATAMGLIYTFFLIKKTRLEIERIRLQTTRQTETSASADSRSVTPSVGILRPRRLFAAYLLGALFMLAAFLWRESTADELTPRVLGTMILYGLGIFFILGLAAATSTINLFLNILLRSVESQHQALVLLSRISKAREESGTQKATDERA